MKNSRIPIPVLIVIFRNIILSGLLVNACPKGTGDGRLLLSQLHSLPLYNRQHGKSLPIRHRGDWDLDVKL
jgi:hypothetical protein